MSKVISGISADLKRIQKNIKEQLKETDTKKMLLMNMPYILTGYFANLISRMYRLADGNDFSEKAMFFMQDLENILANPFPSLHLTDLGIGVAWGIALKFVVLQKAKNAKKFRPGVEYGSARWGTAKDIAPYMDKEFEKNIPLTQTESLMMSGRPKEPKYARNKNILVIGGSGSGKTRFFVKPSLMQLHSSYVVTDPNGYI